MVIEDSGVPKSFGDALGSGEPTREIIVLKTNQGRRSCVNSLLLVSNLILVCSLIVAARSYVQKLAPVAQSFMFKRRTVLAFK